MPYITSAPASKSILIELSESRSDSADTEFLSLCDTIKQVSIQDFTDVPTGSTRAYAFEFANSTTPRLLDFDTVWNIIGTFNFHEKTARSTLLFLSPRRCLQISAASVWNDWWDFWILNRTSNLLRIVTKLLTTRHSLLPTVAKMRTYEIWGPRLPRQAGGSELGLNFQHLGGESTDISFYPYHYIELANYLLT